MAHVQVILSEVLPAKTSDRDMSPLTKAATQQFRQTLLRPEIQALGKSVIGSEPNQVTGLVVEV